MRSVTTKFLPAVAFAALVMGSAGTAEGQFTPVNYSTTGFFTATAPGQSVNGFGQLVAGGSTLTFVGNSLAFATVPNGGYSNANYGRIELFSTTPPTSFDVFNGALLTINLTQTVPGPTGSNTFPGTLQGTVNVSSTGLDVIFPVAMPNVAFSINGINYSVQSPALGVPLTTGNGQTTIQGRITATPEPASMVLLATGLVGVFGAVRRKRNI